MDSGVSPINRCGTSTDRDPVPGRIWQLKEKDIL